MEEKETLLKSEISEMLSGFDKRMLFVNIVKSLTDYRYPDNIRRMIPRSLLDNVILCCLVFIKEKTLANDQSCTMEDIEQFLCDIRPVMPEDVRINEAELARYIIVEVLQNGGLMKEYPTLYEENGNLTLKMMPIRLINEENQRYHLTDTGFDFLFRMLEIENELDYSVTRFRLKEYMKRDNYRQALNQSRQMVARIRQMKQSMDHFLIQCRENISSITTDLYDSIIARIRILLESEYEELIEIQDNAKERMNTLGDAEKSGVSDEDMRANRRALQEIITNISITISEQKTLINKRTRLSSMYESILYENFTASRYERFNFKNEILRPLQYGQNNLPSVIENLLAMLSKPKLGRLFSLETFYAPQTDLEEAAEEKGIDLQGMEVVDDDTAIRKQRDERNIKVIYSFLAFAQKQTKDFSLTDYIETLSIRELAEMGEENTLPRIMLALYSMEIMDLDAWRDSGKSSDELHGEFDLGLILERLPEHLTAGHGYQFTKRPGTCRYSFVKDETVRTEIEISDFTVHRLKKKGGTDKNE